MTNIRADHNKDNPYVQLNRKTLQTPQLSWQARGLWSYLLSLPGDWNVNVTHLISQTGAKRDAIHTILKELKAAQLCRLLERRQENGRWEAAEYVIYENVEKFKESLPRPDNPDTVNPELVKPDVYKEDILHKSNSKKKSSPKSKIPDLPHSFSEEVEYLTGYFLDNLSLHPSGERILPPTPKSLIRWKTQLDLMIRIDKRAVEEIEEMMNYVQQDHFWCQNILSIPTLRAKWSTLSIQKKMKKPSKEKLLEKNRAYAKEVVKTLRENMIPNEVKLHANSSYLEIGVQGHPHTKILEYSDHRFRDQVENELRRMDLIKHLT